ncbi:MAG: hypothetical protein IPL65_07040 [Lewinellaceae bacterium]|nr:hypothetical protein [Lewinellaceae bacterium]
MNVFLIVSMMLGACFIFLLFRKLHVPAWYAGLAALGITFLSPQYNRFDGHFGLSHTFVIPLLLYLLCLYEERFSRRYHSLLIGMALWFSAQLHFYYFGLGALFLTLYTAFQIFRDFNRSTLIRRISHWVVMVLIPFALLNLWIHWSDYTADRPSNPYGFTVYIGYWEGVFLPYSNFPLAQWINQHLVKIREVNGEAIAYAGMLATLFTLWLLFSGFKMFGKTWKEAAYHRVHQPYLRGIFIAAFVLLLFSFGFPFAIPGMEWMVNLMGPLRQFRGLGRFTWAYYYVINIIAIYSLWNYSVRFEGLRNGKYRWLKWPIALLPLLLLGAEARLLQHKKIIETAPNPQIRAQVASSPDHWLNKVDFSRFQALLPLPYYHIGSENIWMDFDYGHFKNVQTTAYHTGVPDIGVNLSRTSARQTTASVQFVLEPCESPSLLDELPDNRPIALLINPSQWDKVREAYPQFIEKATLVYDHPELKIMSILPDSIRNYAHQHAMAIAAEIDRQDLYAINQWLLPQNSRNFYVNSL